MIRAYVIPLLVGLAWAFAIVFSLSNPNFNTADILFIILTLVLVTWLANPDRNQK